ncbi:hypothetical protein DFQ28_006579 [Apophysomyces sp. BC1034]|nr:hypothetical protein DFQ29_008640 [Apophysomyces sp. BC1021]KAG0175656.1 hypothetical protein DFQ30_003406 [Apophysomyces sp. BC1015]KAG0194730.1 hypothetical protein DFQ28_006579 [Apophysomyces sp. BC1034]
MGIHGLSTFIQAHPSLGSSRTWNLDHKSQDQFIIDGNAFVHHCAFSNKADWTHGGQYSRIADACRRYVATLQEAGIVLTFLFDGALPEEKQQTRIKRYRSYIDRVGMTIGNLSQINQSNRGANTENAIQYCSDLFLIPPLTLEVCAQTLRGLGVTVRICHGEADGEVVQLAHQLNGYVVSKDSDMHVYPHVGKGYIPLDSLVISSSIVATVYHPQALASLLQINIDMLPLFGTLLGNDYLDVQVVRFPIMHWCAEQGINCKRWPKYVAEFLRKTGDNISAIANALRPILLKSGMSAKQEKANMLEEWIAASVNRYTDLREATSEETYRSRQILDIMETKTFWSSIFLEDLDCEASWIISRPLRQGLYTVMGLSEEAPISVTEYIREKQHLEDNNVAGLSLDEIVKLLGRTVALDTLKHDAEFRKEFFFRLHSSHPADVEHMAPALHPLILSLRYLIHQSATRGTKLANHEVIALIVAGFKSLAPVSSVEVPQRTGAGPPVLKTRSLHLTSQLQSVFYSSYLLDQALDMSIYKPGVLAHIYDGIEVHYQLQIARQGASVGKMLAGASTECLQLVAEVYRSVMNNLEDFVTVVFDYNKTDWLKPGVLKKSGQKTGSSKDRVTKRPQVKGKKTNGTPLARAGANAFDVLSFGCQFEE